MGKGKTIGCNVTVQFFKKFDQKLKQDYGKTMTRSEFVRNMLIQYVEGGQSQPSHSQTSEPESQKPEIVQTSIKSPSQEDIMAKNIYEKLKLGQDIFGNLPCPHDARAMDDHLECVFCTLTIKGDPTQRKVRYHQIYNIGKCTTCIEIHKRQKKINQKIAKEKLRPHLDRKGKPLTKLYRGDA